MWNAETVTAIAAVVALAFSFIGSVFGLGIWISGKFRTVEIASEQRHLQNLDRFRRIGFALVSMGYKNGDSLEPRD